MSKEKEYQLPFTLELSEPVRIGNAEPITSITISRKPKVKDLEGISDSLSSFDKSSKMLSRLTGLLPTVISELELSDFIKLDEVIGYFLEDFRETGTK